MLRNRKGLLYWDNGLGVEFQYNIVGLAVGWAQLTRDDYSVIVSTKGMFDWKHGNVSELEAFPGISQRDREFIKTGKNPTEYMRSLGFEDKG